MMASDQREHLIDLVLKAFDYVPFVKLDAIDNVVEQFEHVVTFLETHLDETLCIPETVRQRIEQVHTRAIDPRAIMLDVMAKKDSKINDHSIEHSNDDTNDDTMDFDDQRHQSQQVYHYENEEKNTHQHPTDTEEKGNSKNVTIKPILGVSLTRDYSSPRTPVRSISKKEIPTNKPIVGIGLGTKNINNPMPTPITIPTIPTIPTTITTTTSTGGIIGSTTAKPSSRAAGVQQIASWSQPQQQTQTGTGTTQATGQQTFTHKPSSRANFTGTKPSDDESEIDGTDESHGVGVARPLPSKALQQVRKASGEFPSPKLGPRSLGAANRTVDPQRSKSYQNLSERGESDSDADDTARVHAGMPPSLSTTANEQSNSSMRYVESASPVEYDDQDDDSVYESESNQDFDLSALARANDPVSKLKSQVPIPVTASPRQQQSHRLLIELALKSGAEFGDQAVDMMPTKKIDPETLQRLNDTEDADGKSKTSRTSKPAFLLSLNSPLTHHGKLMAAKSQLQALLKRAAYAAARVDIEHSSVARDLIEQANTLLMNSTTIASSKHAPRAL